MTAQLEEASSVADEGEDNETTARNVPKVKVESVEEHKKQSCLGESGVRFFLYKVSWQCRHMMYIVFLTSLATQPFVDG